MQSLSYYRLKETLENAPYRVNIEKGVVISYGKQMFGKQIGKLDKKTGYIVIRFKYLGKRHDYYLQDIIATQAGWDLVGKKVYHKDKNPLNNAIHNLVLV